MCCVAFVQHEATMLFLSNKQFGFVRTLIPKCKALPCKSFLYGTIMKFDDL